MHDLGHYGNFSSDQNAFVPRDYSSPPPVVLLQKEEPKQQLIAHDSDVYDIAFAKGVHVFASVGADGSVRMFDLRRLEHSTIMYESPDQTPLVRLAWNKQVTTIFVCLASDAISHLASFVQDPNYLATIMQGKETVVILDIRYRN